MIAGMTLILIGVFILTYGIISLKNDLTKNHKKKKTLINTLSYSSIVLLILLTAAVRVLFGYELFHPAVLIGLFILIAAIIILIIKDILDNKKKKKK